MSKPDEEAKVMNGHDTILVDPVLPLTNRDIRNAAILECAAIARFFAGHTFFGRLPREIELEILKLLEAPNVEK